jgi:hypothetical protein
MNCYQVLSYSSLDELTGEVNQKWEAGWRPQGGLTVLEGEAGYVFLQAIARFEKEPMIKVVPKRRLLERHDTGHIAPV